MLMTAIALLTKWANTGQFDLKTFEVKAAPQEKVEGLRPGMSVVLKK